MRRSAVLPLVATLSCVAVPVEEGHAGARRRGVWKAARNTRITLAVKPPRGPGLADHVRLRAWENTASLRVRTAESFTGKTLRIAFEGNWGLPYGAPATVTLWLEGGRGAMVAPGFRIRRTGPLTFFINVSKNTPDLTFRVSNAYYLDPRLVIAERASLLGELLRRERVYPLPVARPTHLDDKRWQPRSPRFPGKKPTPLRVRARVRVADHRYPSFRRRGPLGGYAAIGRTGSSREALFRSLKRTRRKFREALDRFEAMEKPAMQSRERLRVAVLERMNRAYLLTVDELRSLLDLEGVDLHDYHDCHHSEDDVLSSYERRRLIWSAWRRETHGWENLYRDAWQPWVAQRATVEEVATTLAGVLRALERIAGVEVPYRLKRLAAKPAMERSELREFPRRLDRFIGRLRTSRR